MFRLLEQIFIEKSADETYLLPTNRIHMNSKFYYKDSGAPKTNLPPSVGCVAIIKKGEKYLLEHRADSDRWAFIGRRLEENENFEECVIRETLEETNLIVISAKLSNTFSDPSRIIEYPDGNSRRIITITFNVKVEDFTHMQCSEESTKLKFFTQEEILKVKIAETHLPILESLFYSR